MWKPICHWHTQKEKTPSRSGNLRKGVLFSAYGPSAIRQATYKCNGDDRRQWRKQGGAVGAAASRMRAAAKQTLGAATRAVSPKVTERASPAGKSRRRSDGQAFCQSDTIAVSGIRRQQPSPLSLVALLLASSPRGGAIGMSVSFRLDERSTMSRKQQCSAV